jgi:hypothetical protein
MKINRRIFAALLILLLLMVQQSVVAHTLTHWNGLSQNQQEQQLPHEENCDQCIAFSQFSSTLTSNFSIPITDFAVFPSPSCPLPQAIFAQTFSVYHSRAPPSA